MLSLSVTHKHLNAHTHTCSYKSNMICSGCVTDITNWPKNTESNISKFAPFLSEKGSKQS